MPDRADAIADDFDADVLILGAGAAGLAAARRLAATHRVLVLEGRDRVGGRILTHHTDDVPLPIDLGPEFIHGRPPETFDLLAESKLIAVDIPYHHFDADENPSQQDDSSWDAAEALLDQMSLADGDDESFEAFLAKHPDTPRDVAARARAYVEGFNAADATRISVRSILESDAEEAEQDGERQHRLIGGYDQLINALAGQVDARGNGGANGSSDVTAGIDMPGHERGRIELGVVVRRVEWKPNQVEVTADTAAGPRTYRAAKAVITLPLGVLQQPETAAAGVRFEPDLPTRGVIQQQLVMGDVRKITLRCRRPFWEAWAGLDASFLHKMNAAIPVWWTRLPLRMPLLTGWAGGPNAAKLSGDPAALRQVAVESLARLFDKPASEIDTEIVSVYTHDWSADPFSRGAYSYVAVGGAAGPDELAKPIDGTLFFAGEHTHRGLIGTVAGAIRTGYRAAEQVNNLTRPQG